jgi:hypothetical protein
VPGGAAAGTRTGSGWHWSPSDFSPAHHFHDVARLLCGDRDRRSDKEDNEADVTRGLGRRLSPGERILVARLLARGRRPAEIAAQLRELEQPAARK